jgi:hypothetical protein
MSHSDICSTPGRARRGAASRALTFGLAGAMVALTGCAASPEPAGAAGERRVVEHAPEILGELETADGAKLTFTAEREHADGRGDPVVAITELAPIGTPSYLGRLRDRGATSLETFLALAPAGTEAPALLREAHAREAAALGRSAELRAVSLDAVAALTPSDNASCDSFAAFTSSVANWVGEQTASSTESHWLNYQSGGNVVAAMCNYDSNRVDYKHAQFCYEVLTGDPFGLLYCDPVIIVPDGYLVDKVWLNATTDRVVRAEKLANYTLAVTSFIGIGGIVPL